MGAKIRLWWDKVRKPLELLGIIFVCMLVLTLLVVIVLTYVFKVDVAGLRGKTLWDWLQLLIIPAVLAVGGYLFNYTTSRNERAATEQRAQSERDIALDNQNEAALQAYIDKMSELLLKEHLGERTADGRLKPEYQQVRNVARVRTISVLTELDVRRIGFVFAFLREAGLNSATSNDNVVRLNDVDLSEVDWEHANLSYADLSGAMLYGAYLNGASLYQAKLSKAYLYQADLIKANLSYADLSGADLSGADLSGAILHKTDLSGAYLYDADLSGADLSGAMITEEQLKKAKSLTGATMPDGTKHS